MARVCQEWFPVGSYKRQKEAGFYMDDVLKSNLDILIKNIVNDWDATIVISASGGVRMGKSVLAFQIACYWHYQIWKVHGIKIPFTLKNNCVFNGTELIEKGNYLGVTYKYSAMLFDEAGADLEGRKVMHSVTQNVLDYFRECGQYNMLNILVIPEYFDLPRSIAISRSNLLLDVYTVQGDDDMIERGYFKLYSPYSKKQLFRLGKRELNYNAWSADHKFGNFDDVFPFDKEEYKKMKLEALKKREKTKKNKFIIVRDAMFYLYSLLSNKSGLDIAEEIYKLTKIKLDNHVISTAVTFYTEKGNIELEPLEDEDEDDA